jgi:hypothetical protein
MRTTVLYPPLYRQTRTLSEFNERLASESSTINSSALSLEGGGGGTPLITEEIQSLSEDAIANDVPVNLSTAIILKEYPVPSEMKGKTGFLTGYFYLRNQTNWGRNLSFNYGFTIDNTRLDTLSTSLPFYRHDIDTTQSALFTSNNVTGVGGVTERVNIPVNVPKNASKFNAVIANSAVPLWKSQVGVVATTLFFPTGTVQSYTVPAGVTTIRFHLWGSGGNSWRNGTAAYGGSGAYVSARLSVTPGQVLWIVVGMKGGGTNARGGAPTGSELADGGGFSGIFTSNITSTLPANILLFTYAVAAGGGAGGINTVLNTGGGGGIIQGGRAGGTQTAGGAGSGGGTTGGSLFRGGNGQAAGGSGYYGGGGASGNGSPGAGGGSSYISNPLLTGLITADGVTPTSGVIGVVGGNTTMRSFFGATATVGYSQNEGGVVIETEQTNPTFIGSEIKCIY